VRKLMSTAVLMLITSTTIAVPPTSSQAPVLTVTSKMRISPAKSGSEQHPQGVKLSGVVDFDVPVGVESPTLTRGRLLLPRGIGFHGGSYSTCAKETLDSRGPSGCPKRAIVGRVPNFVEDPRPQVTFVNGGARRIWAYTVIYHPSLVKETVGVAVRPLRSRKWAYEAKFVVPSNLRIVAGVPVPVPTRMPFSIGGTRSAAKLVTSEADCPKGGARPYRVELALLYRDKTTSDVETRGRLACR
jgi:hypothetical protein